MAAALLIFVVLLAFVSAAWTLSQLLLSDGAESAGRWARNTEVALGDSPYRAALSTGMLRGGAPRWVRVVCWVAAMGGLATLMLFAPGGSVLIAMTADPYEPMSVLLPALLLLVSASGLPAGMLLIRAARKTVRRERTSEATFGYLYAHHACVAGVMLLVHALFPGGNPALPTSLALCFVMAGCVVAMDCVAVPLAQASSQRIS